MTDAEYPSEEQLTIIKNWKPDGHWKGREPWLPLLRIVADAWNCDMGRVVESENMFTFITGGWSGNEDIIGALSDNFTAWNMLWISSHRGGKFVLGVDQ